MRLPEAKREDFRKVSKEIWREDERFICHVCGERCIRDKANIYGFYILCQECLNKHYPMISDDVYK